MNHPESLGSDRSTRRTDIQILRGYAVLLVVIYHAGLDLLPGGFVGVDIFFVISGFLITGIIRRDIKDRTFSLQSFYLRRAKRLFPAAYVTLLVTVLVSPYLLTSSELKDFGKQLIGALTFTANYALKSQTGYFDSAADLKPLLHTWSLSVEEQFYFLIPTLLLIIPRRVHGVFFGLLFLTSLAGCFLAKANPETIFYTLPYRGWELALGALGAMLPRKNAMEGQPRGWVIALPWLVLGAIPLISATRQYPVLSTLVACLATVCLLVAPGSSQKSLIQGMMVRIGDLSYALYLVHWPLFAYFNNLLIQPAPMAPWIRVGLIPISLLLAWALHHTIEMPCLRSPANGMRLWLPSVIVPILLIGLFRMETQQVEMSEPWIQYRTPNRGLNQACVAAGPMDFEHCRNAPLPRYLVWGDSMAMHLVNGIALSRTPQVPLMQATRHACAPLIGLADYRNKSDRHYQWESVCMAFNDQILENLGNIPTLRTVILSGNFTTFLKPERRLVYRSNQHGLLEDDLSHSNRVFAALKQTIDGIRANGLRVVIVSAPPHASFDVSRCLERKARALFTYGGDLLCRIDQRVKSPEFLALTAFLEKVKSQVHVNTLTFEDMLCEKGMCNTNLNGIPLYRDDSHFSNEGGALLIKNMKLIELIDDTAR